MPVTVQMFLSTLRKAADQPLLTTEANITNE